jgi:DNA-binding NarL/FixJ family response regulator
MSARLLIADDHETTRMGVRLLLAGEPELEVCGEARDGQQTLEKVVELAPDVVILDLSMPDINGFQIASRMRQIAPAIRIVFFTMHEVPSTAREMGADAFVLKSSAARDLVVAVKRVLKQNRAAGNGV